MEFGLQLNGHEPSRLPTSRIGTPGEIIEEIRRETVVRTRTDA